MQEIIILEVLGGVLACEVQHTRVETPWTEKKEYATPLDAIKDGWRLLSAPTFSNRTNRGRMIYEWWFVRDKSVEVF